MSLCLTLGHIQSRAEYPCWHITGGDGKEVDLYDPVYACGGLTEPMESLYLSSYQSYEDIRLRDKKVTQ